MEEKDNKDINTWKITIPIVIAVVGFILILSSLNPKSSYQATANSNNLTPNIHNPNNIIKALPINTPIPTKTTTTPKIQPTLKKPSQWASVIAAYTFLNTNKQQQNDLLKQFSNETNNLATAQNNFAIAMDSNPKLLKEVETLMFLHMSKNMSGYNGTTESSGHDAGYEWAEENGIDNIDDCGGNSDSFIEGCQSYVEDNYPPEDCEDDNCEE